MSKAVKVRKQLTDDFSDDEEGFSYARYLRQTMVNGQLKSFAETLKEIDTGGLITFAIMEGSTIGPQSIWMCKIREEIEGREYVRK